MECRVIIPASPFVVLSRHLLMKIAKKKKRKRLNLRLYLTANDNLLNNFSYTEFSFQSQ